MKKRKNLHWQKSHEDSNVLIKIKEIVIFMINHGTSRVNYGDKNHSDSFTMQLWRAKVYFFLLSVSLASNGKHEFISLLYIALISDAMALYNACN